MYKYICMYIYIHIYTYIYIHIYVYMSLFARCIDATGFIVFPSVEYACFINFKRIYMYVVFACVFLCVHFFVCISMCFPMCQSLE